MTLCHRKKEILCMGTLSYIAFNSFSVITLHSFQHCMKEFLYSHFC
ncbi:hypothetical protein X975_15794, partial [Stegodyphus mimosarum]